MRWLLPAIFFLLLLPSVNAATTGTAGGTSYGPIPYNWRGVHDASLIAYPQYVDTNNDSAYTGDPLRDYDQDILFADGVSSPENPLNTRADQERDNNCLFGVIGQNCTDRTDSTNPLRNVFIIENNTNYSQHRGAYKMQVLESPAFGNSDNLTICGSGSDWPDCGANNLTAHIRMGVALLQRTYDAAAVAVRRFIFAWENEPYSGTFLYSTGTCDDRIDYIIDNWPTVYNVSKQYLPADVLVSSPSFTGPSIILSSRRCGWEMAIAFLGNYSGTIYEPDLIDFHPYCSNGSLFCLATEIKNITDLVASYTNYTGGIMFSEMNTNNAVINRMNIPLATNELLWGQIVGINGSVDQQYVYQWSCRGAYLLTGGCQEGSTLFHGLELFNSTPVVRHSLLALNHTKFWYGGWDVEKCVTNNTNVKCFFTENGTNGTLTIMNFNNATENTSITFSGFNITSVTSPLNTSLQVWNNASVVAVNMFNYTPQTVLLAFNSSTPEPPAPRNSTGVVIRNGVVMLKNGVPVLPT